MLKIGHRGAAGYEPENTLLSFQKALDMGIDMIELDVFVCRSGEIVAIHDDELGRTTDGSGKVAEKKYAELKKLDAGKGERIPELGEVLDLVDRKARVNIELKGKKTAKPVSDLIGSYVRQRGWSYDDFLVSSFDHRELRAFREINSAVDTGVNIDFIREEDTLFAREIGASSIHPSIKSLNREFVDDAHNLGLKVYVWTVDEASEIARVKQMGVDGIFSNYPDRL